MGADLVLTVLQERRDGLGFVGGIEVTGELIVATGGLGDKATMLASSNARRFETRALPGELGLRDVLAVGDALWVCGEAGMVAVSHDRGATWTSVESGTSGCLFGVAAASDGAIWVVGEDGFAARMAAGGDSRLERVDVGTKTRLSGVYAVRDEVVMLGYDGLLRRWRRGELATVQTGAPRALTAMTVTKQSWIVVGDGGFVGRSPDGSWFSRASSQLEVDVEAVASLGDGRVVAVGDRGQILLSTDDGRTWRVMENELTSHLWSVKRFGGGVLIGGDDGLIVKLAPPGDETWSDRADVFGEAQPLDAAFAAGPAGFIDGGLAEFLRAAGEEKHEHEREREHEHEDREPFKRLGKRGDATSFRSIYGVELPREVATFRAHTAKRDPYDTFAELRLDQNLYPDVGDHNLFELLVCRNQQAFLGTDLVEAFCGVFAVGSQGDGDTYHLELYEWNGPRQVMHFDHEGAQFDGVFADSLDSLVYLAAIVKAGEARTISPDAYRVGLRKLRGKVAPSWHFSIEDKDADFEALESKRRETEFFYHRARWIIALLRNDGVTEVADVRELFVSDLNQVVPADQLPARYEACEKFIPTALYAIWRAFLFDEPDLARYLDIAARHPARMVRDAGALVAELRAGRMTLGTITDVPAWLAAFRALDLDPRRAGERAAEAEIKAKAEAVRGDEVGRFLDDAPRDTWAELAWGWLDDGVAHRALLARLDREPRLSAQIARLHALHDLEEGARAIALPRLAVELAPELEAVLVGALVRDDASIGLPPAAEDAADGDDDEGAPGWDAIDRALERVYHGADPTAHYGTNVPFMLGGNDPIHGISVYARSEPVPHLHFVTYGFTDLFHKENDDPDESGFGFELTFRLARDPADEATPTWVLNFLQNLGRYVFQTGNRFGAGHKMGLNGPIALEHDTKITAICFADDPELGDDIVSAFGKARFVQIVGITDDEYKLIQEWSTTRLVDMVREMSPLLVTDLARDSLLDDPVHAIEVRRLVDAEGSSEDLAFAGDMYIEAGDGGVRVRLGALYAAALPRAMRGRLRHGRPYELRGRETTLVMEPGEVSQLIEGGDEVKISLAPVAVLEIEERLRDVLAGTYELDAWPSLTIEVTTSFIRDQQNRAIEVRGVADPEVAKRLIDEENDKAAAAAEVASEDDELDSEDRDEDGADAPPALDRIRAAIAMTERALRLSPDDDETQFTHAMLLLDAERAGEAGKGDALLSLLPTFEASTRVNVAVRMGQRGHERFAEAVDIALGEALPERISTSRTVAVDEGVSPFGDVADELFQELGEAVLEHAPDRMSRLIVQLPDKVELLSSLAICAAQAKRQDAANALYDRLFAIPIPDDGDERTVYLRALNNACVQAHAAHDYATAVRIADRAQPVARENPYIYHAAACAYAAAGDLQKALQQVRLAVAHGYVHLAKLEIDGDLGALLDWPEFKALFRDWHAHEEGN